MTIEEMKEKKREFGYSVKEIANRAGLPQPTVQKIFAGQTKAPRRETIEKLERVFSRADRGPVYDAAGKSTGASLVRELGAAYEVNQGHTLADYLALPEEQRVELIDGVFYDMAAPTTIHQAIGGFLHKQLLDHVLEHGGNCMPFMSPVDVQLDEDDKTVVQPDVLIVCDRGKFQNGRVFGAPDFLVEVLSPSTRRKDMFLKLAKYRNAGVREYWVIDPDKKSIVVYDLEHDALPALYGEKDSVPVLIWEGACRIDFEKIFSHIAFLYEQ